MYWFFYNSYGAYNRLIGLVGRVFANGPGDLGSIPGRVKPKNLKIVFDTFLLNTQQYKLRIKGKLEQSRETSSALSLHLGVVTIEKGAFWSLSTTVANFSLLMGLMKYCFIGIEVNCWNGWEVLRFVNWILFLLLLTPFTCYFILSVEAVGQLRKPLDSNFFFLQGGGIDYSVVWNVFLYS